MKFYHGTSTETGVETGDRMDPAFGQFEAAVYATSDIKIARKWAADRAAVAGGSAVVFEVLVLDEAVIHAASAVDACEFERIASGGADAIVDADGEGGATDLIILSRWAAEFGGAL